MDNANVKEQISGMEVGQVCSFPIERLAVIRTYASNLSLLMNRKYKTSSDKENRTISVERVS